MTTNPCPRCRGCGRIADSADGEPWSMWAELPPPENLAVVLGVVKPIPCPACGGSGEGEAPVSVPEPEREESPDRTPTFFALAAVEAERRRQDELWGRQDHDLLFWLAIAAEELGETAREAIAPNCQPAAVRDEAVQLAASIVAMIEYIERELL